MTSCPTLPASRQLAGQLGVDGAELCMPEKLPALLDAVRTVSDRRAACLVMRPLPMLFGLVVAALLCGVPPLCGVLRWVHGQDAGVLAAFEWTSRPQIKVSAICSAMLTSRG